MQELPKIVAQRLRASRSVMDHPDPNVLTAFSERLLPESERAVVLEHLARCDDCREVLALALPATEDIALARNPSPARSGWLSLPVLRWGVVAAAVLLVCTVGLMQRQAHGPAMSKFVDLKTENKVAEARAKTPAPLADSTPQSTVMTRAEADKGGASTETKRGLIARGMPAKASLNGRRVAGTIAAGSSGNKVDRTAPLAEGFRAENAGPKRSLDGLRMSAPRPAEPASTTPASAAVSAPAAASEMVEVQADSPVVVTRDQIQGRQKDELAQLQDEDALKAQQPVAGDTAQRYAKAKAAAVPSAPAPSAAAWGGGLSAAAVLWSISSGGAVQRSLDGGKTWQAIGVSGNPMIGGSLSVETLSRPARAKKTDKALKEAAPPVFRAVAATGPDVWAGGSAGILYHSSDGGESWMRITPSNSSVTLTGDIVSIEFADPQHGKVATSASETWMTSDRGLTWQKQ